MTPSLGRSSDRCECVTTEHDAQLVAVTGGPGAGKTALLELARRDLCEHVVILPSAADIVLGGGFPRGEDDRARRAAERAIFQVQRELERQALESSGAALILCDRGTLDVAAYWPGEHSQLWHEVGTSRSAELERYSAVVHLHTPPATEHDRRNRARMEAAQRRIAIDLSIADAWRDHRRSVTVSHRHDFLDKARLAIGILRQEMPVCCAAAAPARLVEGRTSATEPIEPELRSRPHPVAHS